MADENVFDGYVTDFSSDDTIFDATYSPPKRQLKRRIIGDVEPAKKVCLESFNGNKNIFNPMFYVDIEKVSCMTFVDLS